MDRQINWKPVRMEDKEIIQSFYEKIPYRSCEYTFANNFLWGNYYRMCYAVVGEMLVFLSDEEKYASVSFPIGKAYSSSLSGQLDATGRLKDKMDLKQVETLKQSVGYLISYFKEKQRPFSMHLVTEEEFELLEEIYPGKFEYIKDRSMGDYIYESEKLISLSGKKLHAKRNYINRFKAAHKDWAYETVSAENKEDCFRMLEKWGEMNLSMDPPEAGTSENREKEAEFKIVGEALNQMEWLGLKGGLIRLDGEVIAFALGEKLSADTFVVHFEKAFASVSGAYTMINQQFAEHEAKEFRYINREEDAGSEGLRKAKLSYYPAFLLEKGIIREK